MNKNLRYFAILSLFIAFSVILGYVEYLIPFDFGIYGFKIGLSNIATVILLYIFDFKAAILVLLLRVVIVNMLFGTMFSFAFSITAGIVSLFIMWLIYKIFKGNIIFTSALGGISHNIVQLVVALFLLQASTVLYLMPYLVILGLITGVIVGIISRLIINRTGAYIKKAVPDLFKEMDI